jgi:predicted amidohydrolase YtcJ
MTHSELPALARHLDGRTSVLLTGARIVLQGGSRTDAVLIAGERILAVGPEARAAASTLAPPAVELELPALPPVTVLPGFIDAHTHLVHQGLELARLDLGPAASSHEAIARVQAALAEHDPDRPFIAEGFDDSSWPAGRLERAMLDRIAPHTAIILRRVCGHLAVANGAALAALAAHPMAASYAERGLIAAESGVLLEDAAMRLRSLFPPTAAELDQAVATAEAMALRLGITSAHDIEDQAGISALARRRRASALALRITVHAAEEQLAGLEVLGIGGGPGDPWLKLGGVKLFLDGSIGARTAALRIPFADRQDRGRLLFETSELKALVRRIDAAGSTAVLHAIGDAAIDQALTALEDLGPQAVRAARHRIEHLELTPDDLIDRLAQVGATASMQPNFVDRWGGRGGLYEQALGPERVRRMNRFRTVLEREIPLAFGSDCMPLGPLSGLRGAISHPVPEERLSLAEALAAYSAGGARAAFSEPETGAIAPGRWADLVLVAGDLFASADPAASQVLATIVGGRLRYAAGQQAPC